MFFMFLASAAAFARNKQTKNGVNSTSSDHAERYLQKLKFHQGKAPGRMMSGSWPHCQISILYVGSATIPHQWLHSISDGIWIRKEKNNSLMCCLRAEAKKQNKSCANQYIFCQKSPFTVNCLAVVALIQKVMMTVHFCFHDTATAVTDTKLHTGQRMFGKCKPQISGMLWSACKTIAQGKRRKNKQKRGV